MWEGFHEMDLGQCTLGAGSMEEYQRCKMNKGVSCAKLTILETFLNDQWYWNYRTV